jgi:hypothetical protein
MACIDVDIVPPMARTRTARPARPSPPPPTRGRSKTWLFLVAGAVVLGLGAWWWLRTPAFTLDVNPNRNVLLVTIDTWRGDALGASGGRVSTPNPTSWPRAALRRAPRGS